MRWKDVNIVDKIQNSPWANVLKLFPLNFKALYLLVQWKHLREGKDYCEVLFLRLLVFMVTSCNAFGVRTLLALRITTSILSLFLKCVSNHAWSKGKIIDNWSWLGLNWYLMIEDHLGETSCSLGLCCTERQGGSTRGSRGAPFWEEKNII